MPASNEARVEASAERRLLELELEYRLFSRDPVAFARCVKIRHPSRGKILFEPYPAQVDALYAFRDERYNLILKARQTGFSTVVAIFVLWLALFHPDRWILMLSRREEDSVKLLEKVIFAYESLPTWLKLRAGAGGLEARANASTQKMTFRNGSAIDSLPATADTGRGEAASLTVVDEWAFFPDPEKTWAALEPTADVGGAMIAISTANGFGNLFHKMWQDAVSNPTMWTPTFYGWEAAPFRDDAWYEAKKASLPEWQLAQEYPADAEEAFVRSARPYFDVDLIRLWTPRKPTRYIINRDGGWSDRRDGPLRMFRLPEQTDTYVVGADTAEGLPHGDYSSAHVLSTTTGEVAATWHGRIDPDLFGSQVLHHLGMAYNFALLGVERNGSGMTTLTALVNAEYPNIYFTTPFDRTTQIVTKKFGWTTSKLTRPLMLDELNEAIRESAIDVWDDGTRQELLSFVRDDNGRGAGSPHDDRVISLAIAVQMLKFAHHPDYVRPIYEQDTLGWWDRIASGETPSNGSYLQDVVGNEGLLHAPR